MPLCRLGGHRRGVLLRAGQLAAQLESSVAAPSRVPVGL